MSNFGARITTNIHLAQLLLQAVHIIPFKLGKFQEDARDERYPLPDASLLAIDTAFGNILVLVSTSLWTSLGFYLRPVLLSLRLLFPTIPHDGLLSTDHVLPMN